MILILSQAHLEPSIEEVMDWIERLGGRCLRLNGEDFEGDASLAFTLDGDGSRLRIEIGGEGDAALAVPLAEVRAVWFRRWLSQQRHEAAELLDLPPPEGSPLDADPRLDYRLRSHLTRESRKLADFFFASLAGRPWLSHPSRASPAKLDVLARAARLGLAIPATLLTTERDELMRFCGILARHRDDRGYRDHGGGPGPGGDRADRADRPDRRHAEVITKPIAEVELFVHGGRRHFMYTAALDAAAVERLPERFAPSLFQERLDKACELRVFYLDGECHAMAIFSQRDPQTRVDFRNYNHERPNRNIPYRLRPATAAALARLMRELELATGSIDLIRTPDRHEVFLEVNPVGQFGMVSKPCNYHLERRMAEHLLRLAGDPPAGGMRGDA